MPSEFDIYTDGSCSGNPGPGGWAAVIEHEGETTRLSGGERSTTNNRMEITAAIRGAGGPRRPAQPLSSTRTASTSSRR